MTRWVALLRGVNVGGITIKSADLRALFGELGFGAVATVLASGNVVFDASAPPTADDRDVLKRTIEQALSERFGYEAWIVLLTQDELASRAGDYPFSRQDDEHHPYLVFGSDEAVLDELYASAQALRSERDALARGSGVIYWRAPKGGSTDTPVAKLVAKARYRSTTTNRNLRTVEKLLKA
ncbi:DUF1697 domain-containing protein [Sediminivirga luteola]|uniref:Pyridoxamine 5'-phosphate oxidase n=1 Tax=Sediminivirga luteola TaxID=1774748 RepID=A0A8J2XL45_9MICO|nr:DUF1697 domain-containing protein [Sediminivirga luteola]GGA19719.1 pyridoxamine 5'-phosphate oxidase [Sediminivirga luteola]